MAVPLQKTRHDRPRPTPNRVPVGRHCAVRRRVGIGVALAATGAVVLAGCSSSPTSAPTTTTVAGRPAVPSSALPYLMISPGHLRALKSGGLSTTLTNYFFNSPKTILNLGANGDNATASEVSAAHRAYPNAAINLLFNSFGTNSKTGAVGIQGYLDGGQVPSGVTYIQYDPESPGNGTPAAEAQALDQNDLTYAQQAAALVHSHNLKFIFSPSTDVGMTSGQGGTNRYKTWLSQDRGAWARTSHADIYCIQTQQIEGTSSFDSFTRAAVAQAKAADPSVLVFVGIGINPHDPSTAITTTDILDAYRYSQSIGAAGFWNNVETNTGANVSSSVYADFFKDVYSTK